MPCKGTKRKLINSTNVNKALLDFGCCSASPGADIHIPSHPSNAHIYIYI